MKFQIKHHFTDKVLFEKDADSMRFVIEAAVESKTDLRGADLSGANLRDANLSDANLRGAYLSDAYLSDAGLRGVPSIKNIHQTVYDAASQDGALDMSSWHDCGSTHCRAGWVTTLAGEAGVAMERCLGPAAAAALIYLKSDPSLERVPDFYATNDEALADMKRLSLLEAERNQ